MSERPLAARLGIRPGATVWVSDEGRLPLLGPMPEGATGAPTLESAEVAVVFAESEASLRASVEAHGDALGTPAVLWVAYPKGNRADINRDSLWPILAEHGFRPVSQVAVDETWSALRFRLLRPGEAPFNPGA